MHAKHAKTLDRRGLSFCLLLGSFLLCCSKRSSRILQQIGSERLHSCGAVALGVPASFALWRHSLSCCRPDSPAHPQIAPSSQSTTKHRPSPLLRRLPHCRQHVPRLSPGSLRTWMACQKHISASCLRLQSVSRRCQELPGAGPAGSQA